MSTSRERKRMSLKSKRGTPLLILMLIVLSAVLPLVFTPHASTDVDLHLIVNLPFMETLYEDVSILGMRDSATQGFDPTWDEIDPPPPPAGIVSYFWYPDNPTSPVNLQKLSTSRISWSDTMTWIYRIKPVEVWGTATISWDAAEIGLIPSNYPVLLLDSEGAVVADMRTVFEYNFDASDGIIYDFTIQMPEIISISVDPSDIDFGTIYEGGSVTSSVTITNDGNVEVSITAILEEESHEEFYASNLKMFEVGLGYVYVVEWNLALPPTYEEVVALELTIPYPCPAGDKTAILVFWAEVS